MKHPISHLITILLGFCLICSCGSTRHVTQLVHDTRVDTVYISSIQYDSVYIYKDKLTDKTQDTIYIRDVSVEYRYKMLRDTVYRTQIDSIPYQVTITEFKEITRPLTPYDRLTRTAFWILILVLIYKLYRLCARYRR